MPPEIALLLCVGFICGALFVDSVRTVNVSQATWVPLAWVTILASRPPSEWFYPTMSVSADVSGSPMDRAVLLTLMLVGAVVLIRRQAQWSLLIKRNAWVVVFFAYCALSTIWSDYPDLALKRWIRALGGLMMILVILTENDPTAAATAVVRRCGFILIPLSVLLIKYYRELGVGYNYWTGEENLFGITTDKNALGRLTMICGLFAFWELLVAARTHSARKDGLRIVIGGVVFAVAIWLLRISHSATALVCFLVGGATVFALGLSIVRRHTKHLGTLVIVGACIAAALNASFDLWNMFLASLGKDPTLTTRTFIWKDLLERAGNPIVGVGYGSFWLGERLEYFVRVHKVTSAHNGYLDVYLELGVLGLIVFSCMLHGFFSRAKEALASGDEYGRLRVAMLFVFLAYNVTEAGWRATHLTFFVLLLVGIETFAPRAIEQMGGSFRQQRKILGLAGRRTPQVKVSSGSNATVRPVAPPTDRARTPPNIIRSRRGKRGPT